jgi:two-component system sensor histidine kinase RegB
MVTHEEARHGAAPRLRSSAPPDTELDPDAAPRLTLPWLLRLRWLALLTQIVLTAAAGYSGWPPTSRVVWALVGLGVLSNLGLTTLNRRRILLGSRSLVGGILLADVLLLTAMLAVTGGPFNPFAVVFLVNVTLAAVTLGSGWTWVIVLSSIGGYASLFAWPRAPHEHLAVSSTWPSHLVGMWLAFATSAVLIALFVTGVTRTLAGRERELSELRAFAARNERLASLTALAAGAAHELATPLATIAVAAGELERAADRHDMSSLADDVSLIRLQVDRCRDILDRMSGRASGKWIETSRPVPLDEIVRLLRDELGADQRAHVRIDAEFPPVLLVPCAGLVQVLRNLVANALDASGPGDVVSLAVTANGSRVAFAVRDHGPGMSADTLERAGEPFFTTKPPGSGYGLGLFLVRHFAERHGGSLVVDSAPERGTTVVLELPRGLP